MSTSAAGATPGTTDLQPPISDDSRRGVLLGLAAYLTWGAFPVFFKALSGAGSLEIVCHRIFWSAVFLLLLVTVRHRLGHLLTVVRDRKTLLTLCASTLLIASNWLVFIHAVQHQEVLQSSLGYFINPLVSILFGFIFLRERLNRPQQLSVLLAVFGVLQLTVQYGRVPWIALVLAVSFGLYGLLRKLARVDAMVGLTVETLLVAPLALGYLILLQLQGAGAFLGGSLRLDLLLPLSGVVTAVPLLWFIGAARRLRLATIGFLQYITPSLHFILAVGLYHEPFAKGDLFSFLSIWAGLGIYSWDMLRQNRARPKKTGG